MNSWRASTEEGGVVVTHDCESERHGLDRLCARGSIPLRASAWRKVNNRAGAGMRIPGALIRQPSSISARVAQRAKELRALRRKSGEAVQVRMPDWFPVKITKEVRCYILGFRLHHGLTGSGCVIVGTVLRKPELVLLGAALCLHDKEDWPWPITT